MHTPSTPRNWIRRETMVATGVGLACALILGLLIVIGSRRLSHFDAALVGYTFATLFAAFGIAYRYAMWLQRPPTALYWRRGRELLLRPDRLGRNLGVLVRRVGNLFVTNSFIWRRGIGRGAAHWPLMWGCLLGAAITFPLVFGWVHFELVPGSTETYRAMLFGFPTASFEASSTLGTLIFHGLAIASFMVIAGVMLAMRRRMIDRDVAATQTFGDDLLPLILLFAIATTGLMLVVSYEWMHGYLYDFLAILHAITVIFTLLWLPFGKFFHIFQRPAQLGVAVYKDEAASTDPATCARCRKPYASKLQVEDLVKVTRELGYRYESDRIEGGHYQRLCPPCRRVLPALTQGKLWRPGGAVAGEENQG